MIKSYYQIMGFFSNETNKSMEDQRRNNGSFSSMVILFSRSRHYFIFILMQEVLFSCDPESNITWVSQNDHFLSLDNIFIFTFLEAEKILWHNSKKTSLMRLQHFINYFLTNYTTILTILQIILNYNLTIKNTYVLASGKQACVLL